MPNLRHERTSRLLQRMFGGRPSIVHALTVLVLASAHTRLHAQSADTLPKYPPVRTGEPSVGYQRSPTVTFVMYSSEDATLFQSALSDKHRRSVTVRSRYFVGGHRKHMVEDVDEFAVRYWPTELSVIAENTLCVGGKSEDGHTVIERWTFAAPTHAVSSPTDGAEPVHTVTSGARLRVEVLYDDAVPGRDIAHVILPVLGSTPPAVLVQFADSADLWRLDTSDKQLTLVATPHEATAAAAAVPCVPLLAQRMRARLVREHPTHGYCYFLLPGGDFHDSNEPKDPPTIVLLRDADKDGVIEMFSQLTGDQFDAAGYGSSASFTSTWTY